MCVGVRCWVGCLDGLLGGLRERRMGVRRRDLYAGEDATQRAFGVGPRWR
jgi:hypothetical protein